MKKILFIFFFLVVLAGGALAFFIATFDAEKHRPTVITKIEEAVGHPVDLARIGLTWRNGIALDLDGLSIYPGKKKIGEPAIELESASALLRLMPLLRGSVELGAIKLVRPKLQVRQEANGDITIPGIQMKKEEETKGGTQTAVGLSFLIESIEIEKGALTFFDYKQDPPLIIALRETDLKLNPISLTRPVNIEADASFLSDEQNLHFKGRFKLPSPMKPARLEDVKFDTDLSLIDLAELARVLPKADLSIIQQSPNGKIKFRAERIDLDENLLSTLKAKAELTGGGLSVEGLKVPFRDVATKIEFENGNLTIENLEARLGTGYFEGLGKVSDLPTVPFGQITANFRQLNLAEVLDQGSASNPQLHGIASGNFQGSFKGRDDYEIKQALLGEGTLKLEETKITNFNLLNEVVSKISIIPGLGARLNERLSEEYKQKLSAPDTMIEPVELPVRIAQGVIEFNSLNITSDGFALSGGGYYGLTTESFGAQTMLSLDAELSNAFIRSVEELSYLTNEQGWLQIPIRVEGNAGSVRVLPDLQYIGSKLATFKAQELLGDLFGRKKEEPQPPGTPPDATTPTAPTTGQSIETVTQEASQPAPPEELSKEEQVVNLVGGLLNSFLSES